MSVAKDERDMKREHRVQLLQSTKKEIIDFLATPDFIATLKEETSNRQFWKEIDLKTLVQWRLM